MEEIDYNKMRYETDEQGYLTKVNFGCLTGSCQIYEGLTPEGYYELEDWYESNCTTIKAWKIVNGNLVHDENRENELQIQFEIEAEKNALATHDWVRNQSSKASQVVIDEFTNNVTGTSLLILEDSGDYEIPNMVIESETITECTAISSNKNLLGIDYITNTINGVEIKNNGDGTITLNGTSTNEIEIDLKGTSTNLDMLFLIQQDLDYVVSGLSNDIKLNLYNFDGTDKTLIGSYTNEVVSLSNSLLVTQTTLYIPNGITFDNVVISPQLEINTSATSFVKHEESKETNILYENQAYMYDLHSYSPITIIMVNPEANVSVDYFKYKTLNTTLTEIKVNEDNITKQVSNLSEVVSDNYDEITDKFNGYTPLNQTVELENSLIELETNSYKKIEIDEKLTDGSVTMLKSTSLVIDNEGLTVDKSDSNTLTNLDADGMQILDKTGSSDEILLEAKYDPENGETRVKTKNMVVGKYLTIGSHSRMEDYEDGTGIFYIW